MKIETRKYLVLTEGEERTIRKAMNALSEVQNALYALYNSTAVGQRDKEELFPTGEKPAAKDYPPTSWDRGRLRTTIQKLQAKAVVLQHCADDLLATLKETR